MAKFLTEYNKDITLDYVEQNCLVDKTNRTKQMTFGSQIEPF